MAKFTKRSEYLQIRQNKLNLKTRVDYIMKDVREQQHRELCIKTREHNAPFREMIRRDLGK
jgi:hypothetical protein